jgi:hypothetical protein
VFLQNGKKRGVCGNSPKKYVHPGKCEEVTQPLLGGMMSGKTGAEKSRVSNSVT